MILTNKNNIPRAFLRAIDIKEAAYNKGDAKYSVTGLMKSPRQLHLARKYWKEIEEDYSDKLDSWIGHLMHKALNEMESEGVLTERLSEEFCGVLVSGETDHYNPRKKRIRDYKYTSVYSWIYEGRNQDYEIQTNKYGYLFRSKGYDVKTLEICYFFKDWKRSEAQNNPKYPPTKILIKKFPIWDFNASKEYIESRVLLMESTEHLSEDDLPECTPDEKWQSESVWKIFKKDGKKAIRGGVFDSELEAETRLIELRNEKPKDTFRIEELPGEAKKCLYWCNVSKFCKYAYGPKEGEGNGS